MKARILLFLLATCVGVLGQTKTLNQFPELPEAPNAADWVYVWDVSAAKSVKVSTANFFKALPVAGTSTIGGVKRNAGASGEFVSGIDSSGNLVYGTPAGSGVGVSGIRIPYGNGSGALTSEAGLEYNASTNVATVPNLLTPGEVRFGTSTSVGSSAADNFYISANGTGDDLVFDLSVDNAARVHSGANVGSIYFDGIHVKGPIVAYNEATWNGSNIYVTQDAVRDQFEVVQALIGSGIYQEHNDRLDQLVDGTLTFSLTLEGPTVFAGPVIIPRPAMTGNTMDLQYRSESQAITGDEALAFSPGTPGTGQVYEALLVADSSGPYTVSFSGFIPFSYNQNTTVSSVPVEADSTILLVFQYEGSRWAIISGDPVTTTGSGSYVLNNSPTIYTPAISGAIGFPNGVLQTFNPSATTPGWSPGSTNVNPSGATDGTAWYNTTTGKFTFKQGGTIVQLGTGSLDTTAIDTSAELRTILIDETGTGAAVFAASPTFTGTVTMDTLNVTTLAASGWEFEGVANNFETNVVATDPTADNTITLPDATGYVTLTTGGPPGSTRIPFGHTDGTLATDSVFNYNTGTDTLAVPNLTLSTGGALGASTATTPAANDNDTSVATTAYVQTEISGLGGGTVDIASSRQNVFLWDEFIGVSGSSPFGALGLLREVTGGTVGSGLPTGTTSASGVMNMYTSTGTTNKVGVIANASAFSIMFGGGTYVFETRVNIETLPATTTNEYVGRIGFLDAISTQPIDGCYFQYDAASANWFAVCRANNVETASAVSTGVAVTNNTWIKLRIEVNAAASSVLFYIDGTLVRTETANIPSGASRSTSVGAGFIKSTGSVDNDFFFDYVGLEIGLTAAR